MLKYILSIIISIILTTPSYTDEMIYINKLPVTSKDETIYLLKRCASVTLVMIGAIQGRDATLDNEMDERYEFYSMFAVRLLTGDNYNNIREYTREITEDVVNITNVYKVLMDKSRFETGKSIPDIISSDTIACRILQEQLKG